MKIAIGSDHAGLRLKKLIIERFKDMEFDDVGTYTEDSCDYPDFALKVARMVVSGECEWGIVICGTGIGISIAANKVPGVRAALCCNSFMAQMARVHNNANILALGARVVGDDLAFDIVSAWRNASFEGGRHQRRLDRITDIEKESCGKN